MLNRRLMAIVLAALAGCAAVNEVDRTNLSKLEFLRTDESGAKVFRFVTAGNETGYPIESPEAEKARMIWLRTYLDDNGFNGQPYEIISRQPIVKGNTLFGKAHEIFYEVKVAKIKVVAPLTPRDAVVLPPPKN